MKTLRVTRPYNGMVAVKNYLLEKEGEYIISCEGKERKVFYPRDVVNTPMSDKVQPSKFGKPYKLVYFMWYLDK